MTIDTKKQVGSVPESQKGMVGQETLAEQEQTAHVDPASIPVETTKEGVESPKGNEKKKKERGLSVRERKAIAFILEGKTKKDALIAAGYSENTATHNPNSVLGKNVVIRALMKAFEDAGISETKLAQKQLQLLDAKKIISTVVRKTGEAVDANRKTMDFVEVDDNLAQVKALELLYKVRGDFAPEVNAVVTESYAERIKRLRGMM